MTITKTAIGKYLRKATRDEKIASPGVYEVPCTTHPDAPHGFNLHRSLNEDRYVCECDGWVPGNTELCGGVPHGLTMNTNIRNKNV